MEGFCRQNKRGGGVALYIRDDIVYKTRNDISVNNSDIESCFIELVNNHNSNVVIGVVYKSPSAPLNNFIELIPDNNFIVESAGTSNYHIGELPDKRSIEVAKKYNIDITNQRGRQFKVSDFDEFDYIYVMDTSNYNNVIALARNSNDKEKVQFIRVGFSFIVLVFVDTLLYIYMGFEIPSP